MIVFIAVSSLSLCVLLAQGIRVILMGNMRPFFWCKRGNDDAGPQLKPVARIFISALYVISSAVLIYAILDVIGSNHGNSSSSTQRVGDSWSLMTMALCFVVYGAIAITRPDIVIRWVLSIYVDTGTMYSEQASFRMTVMLLGAIFVCAGIALLLR
jgi:hypothetical protein